MGTYCFIKSKLSGNVIDIIGASTTAGAGLDAFPQKSTGNNNQLWAFVSDPAGSGYYFIESKLNGNAIDIKGGSALDGAALDVNPPNLGTGHNSASQLWQFIPDPAGSGYYFIQNNLTGHVIDIASSSKAAGATLDAYPMKMFGNDNQLWEPVGGSFPPAVTMATPPSNIGGFTQYVFSGGGATAVPLTNMKVTLDVIEDIVTSSLSLQINGFSQRGDNTICWQQYGFQIEPNSNQLSLFAENWPESLNANPNAQNVFNIRPSQSITLPKALTIPAGWSILIAFQDVGVGLIGGFKCTVTDSAGATVGNLSISLLGQALAAGGTIGQGDLAEIVAFQVCLVGWANSAHAELTSGMGTITCASSTSLTPSVPWPPYTDGNNGTAESSNCAYGLVPAKSSLSIVQTFGATKFWSAQTELTDRATSTGPALALNGVLCMAWQGVGQNNIWVSVSRDNGSTWSPQLELTDRATRDAPALTVVAGKFAMAWRGLNQDNIFVSTSTDGLSWSPQTELGDRSTSAGPALAAVGGLAVMAWKGTGQSNIWVATSTDGIHWSGQVELTDRATQHGPALAAAPGKFTMAWCGLNQNNIFVSTSTDGVHWGPQQELTDRATTASPAITYSPSLGFFYMGWRGLGQANIWVSSSSDGINWSGQVELTDRATNSGPALSPVASTLYMAWQGVGQNNIWTSIFVNR